MTRQTPAEIEGQGSFLSETITTLGGNDPHLQTRVSNFEPAPEGVYPEAPATDTEPEPVVSLELSVPEAVAAANKTTKHHKAQVGRHSPMQRDGNYQHIQVGDYLPGGFGAVTYGNFEDAWRHAEQLEADR